MRTFFIYLLAFGGGAGCMYVWLHILHKEQRAALEDRIANQAKRIAELIKQKT